MCTVVLLLRPGHVTPVMLAANRDEMIGRAWDGPGFWWPRHPGVIGGRDRLAGGTWMALNRHGVMAAVLNRPGSLGPAEGKRSRGELPLIALEEATSRDAADAIARLDAGSWRSFNMVIADLHQAFFVRGLGEGAPEVVPLPAGVWMITAHDPNDTASPRIARHLARFRAATPPDEDHWAAWKTILADRSGSPVEQINVVPRAGFGTVCSSLLGFSRGRDPEWLFAAGAPDRAEFVPVPA